MVLRERLGDFGVSKMINVLRADTVVGKRDTDEGVQTNKGINKERHEEQHVLVDSVFEEQLVLSLDDDDEEEEYSLSVNGDRMPSSEAQSQFTQEAAHPLLSAIHSSDHTIAQADDVDIKYNVSGVTRDSTGTDGSLWDTISSEEILLATDTPPPFSEDFYPSSASCSPLLSPVDLALTRLIRPTSSEQTDQRGSPPMETCDLSPSLVALEVDSEEESVGPKSPLSPLSSDVERSEDKEETFPLPSPDLTCTRSQSASAYEPTSQVIYHPLIKYFSL